MTDLKQKKNSLKEKNLQNQNTGNRFTNSNFKKSNSKVTKGKLQKFNQNKTIKIPEKKYPIDYKRLGLLRHFVTKYGKIRPRRVSKIPLKQQKKVAKAIRRARAVGLIPCLVLAKS